MALGTNTHRYRLRCSSCGKLRPSDKHERQDSAPKKCMPCHNEGQRELMARMMRRPYLKATDPRRNR